MKLQPVTYRGRLAAVCSPHRVYFAEWIEVLELDHPIRRFVSAMCLYAGENLNGVAATSYSDDAARRRARARLVPVTDLLADLAATNAELAESLNVPLDEIRLARASADVTEVAPAHADGKRSSCRLTSNQPNRRKRRHA